MPATAILFPGQGSQTPEMRDAVRRWRPDLLELVAEAVGEDPFARVEENTRFAQPAIMVAALAGWEALGHPDGDFMAGHSLGEITALVAAGAAVLVWGGDLVEQTGSPMEEGDGVGE